MKSILFVVLCLLLVSCAHTPFSTGTEIKEVQLSQRDTKLVLNSIGKFDGETAARKILLCESWREEDGANLYRIVLDTMINTPEQPKAYMLSKSESVWKVLERTF